MSEVNDNNATQELAPSEPVQKTPSPTPGTSTQTPPSVLLTTPEIPANERNSNDFIMKPHTSSVTAVPLLSLQDSFISKSSGNKTVLNKRKRKSAILTDTPIKNELAEQQKMRKLKPKIPKKKKVQGKKKKSNRLAAAKRMNLKTFFV